MTSVFKDCCRLLSCLLVFSGLVSAWACLCVWLAGLLGQWWAWQLLSVRGPQVTHTFSILSPSTQPSQRNGKDRCCNQCAVCGNKRQQLTEKLCMRQYTRLGVGWHKYAHISLIHMSLRYYWCCCHIQSVVANGGERVVTSNTLLAQCDLRCMHYLGFCIKI